MNTVSYHLPDCHRSLSQPNQKYYSQMPLLIGNLMLFENWTFLLESDKIMNLLNKIIEIITVSYYLLDFSL